MEDEKNKKRDNTIKKAGVAVGIGSAAVAAALLYANSRKKNDRSKK